jgi:hypothetical protein
MFENVKKNYKHLKSDIKPKGLINIIILITFIITSHGWLKNNGIFDGFTKLHYVLWYILIFVQVGYIINALLLDPLKRNKMEKAIYKLFTEGGLQSIKNIIIISDEEALLEAFLIILTLVIPFPFNVKMDNKYKIMLGLSKLGFFHLLASIIKHY